MSHEFEASAHATQLGNSLPILTLLIQIIGLAWFAYIVYNRVLPMLHAERDLRLDRPGLRIQRIVKYWFGQWKHPRLSARGHLTSPDIRGFSHSGDAGFLSSLYFGLSGDFTAPAALGRMYNVVADYAATIVFLAVAFAAVRRIVFKPAR
jgi:hypothetical protein